MRLTACLLLLLLAPLAFAAEGGWKNQSGTRVADTDDARSRDGFAARLQLTADPDWQQKWETPPDNVPSIGAADHVEVGGRLTALVFLANPALDAAGRTDVRCDVRITDAGGEQTVQEGTPCFNVTLKGDPTYVYLANLRVEMSAEATDPKGTWTIEVTVTDALRGVSLPLRTTFELR